MFQQSQMPPELHHIMGKTQLIKLYLDGQLALVVAPSADTEAADMS